MRYHDNGCFHSVSVSRRDVERFANKWPCFGPRRPLWFQFHKETGDLVDIGGNTNDMDEHGVLALSEDAQAYASGRRGNHDRS